MSDGMKAAILAVLAFAVASLAGFVDGSAPQQTTAVEVQHE